jgi:hypothetical protein
MGCAGICLGLTFQHGHLYLDWGGGFLFGGGVGLSLFSRPIDKNTNKCDRQPTHSVQGYYVGGSIGSKKDWSISPPGKGGLVGYGVLCTNRLR